MNGAHIIRPATLVRDHHTTTFKDGCVQDLPPYVYIRDRRATRFKRNTYQISVFVKGQAQVWGAGSVRV